MKVVIIGTGNAATVLGRKIQRAGHEIIQVIGRDLDKAHQLGAILHCPVFYNIRYLKPYADLYLLAVSDSYLATLAPQIKLQDKIIVHTSAATSADVLKNCSENYGVLYPLQTLHKDTFNDTAVPVLVDANNDATKETLVEFATQWADSVEVAGDDERLKLHVAAVFINNFTNHLFTLVDQYCQKEQLKFNVLDALIEETVERIKVNSPAEVQTGPAIRKDFATLERHQEVLSTHPRMQELYKSFSNSIIQYYDENKSLEKE